MNTLKVFLNYDLTTVSPNDRRYFYQFDSKKKERMYRNTKLRATWTQEYKLVYGYITGFADGVLIVLPEFDQRREHYAIDWRQLVTAEIGENYQTIMPPPQPIPSLRDQESDDGKEEEKQMKEHKDPDSDYYNQKQRQQLADAEALDRRRREQSQSRATPPPKVTEQEQPYFPMDSSIVNTNRRALPFITPQQAAKPPTFPYSLLGSHKVTPVRSIREQISGIYDTDRDNICTICNVIGHAPENCPTQREITQQPQMQRTNLFGSM